MQFRLQALACAVAALPFAASAQVTQKPDGEWRSLFTLGASFASGNTKSSSVSLSGDVIKLTSNDKWAFNGQGQYARNNGEQTAQRAVLGGLHTRDINERVFGFGQLDLLHDKPANLKYRWSAGGGLGYHLLRGGDNTWDVSAGLGYTQDHFDEPDVQDGVARDTYSHADLLLSEESTHKLTATTSFRQKFSVFPNLKDRSDYRATFDAGLSVAISQQLALTATLSQRYDSRPSAGFGSSDTLFVTGVSYRLD